MNSELKTKVPIRHAEAVASWLLAELAPMCERIELCGSIRRRKPMVSDIEILFIPKLVMHVDLFGDPTGTTNLAAERIDAWVSDETLAKRPNKIGSHTWGPRNKLAVHVRTGIAVDFFETDAQCFHVALVIRTGSKETNLQLTTTAQRNHMMLHAYGGIEDLRTGQTFYPKSEPEVFELCGVKYLVPEQR